VKRLMIRRAILLAGVFVCCPVVLFGASGSHSPIVIASDSDFQTCICLSGGSGTPTNPYIIGPWTTNSLAPGGVGLSVDGTLLRNPSRCST
jgi:hypothetical protein